MTRASTDRHAASVADVEAVVIGAGFAGLYALHRLRDTMGVSVRGFDAGADVGGTWYWNRYPGARCDIESIHYSYSFSEELQQEWEWSEKYAAQPEILRYLNHVADRFDLRRSFTFDTRIVSTVWDDSTKLWILTTEDGDVVTAKFVVSGVGNLSVPKKPEFPGIENFQGEVYTTGNWPHEPVDFTGKRVGVIGTGSSGIQVIQEIAKQAAHMTVFQRTANYATPLRNSPSDPDEIREVKAKYADVRTAARNHPNGVTFEAPDPSALAVSAEERRRKYDELWETGGFRMFMASYADLVIDEKANETAAQYIRDRIKDRVKNPEVAELLSPKDHHYATKRPPLETAYYEVYNRENVALVDVKTMPIEEITATSIRIGQDFYEFDVLVLATGFDAITGPLLKMGVVGRGALELSEKWADGPHTYLGITMHGFPNLFALTGPQSATAFYNNPLAIEDHVEFATDAIKYLKDHDIDTIEPTLEAEKRWNDHVLELADMTLVPKNNSWYMGSNVPGKPRVCMIYVGGAVAYRAVFAEVVDKGYDGFTLDRPLIAIGSQHS